MKILKKLYWRLYNLLWLPIIKNRNKRKIREDRFKGRDKYSLDHNESTILKSKMELYHAQEQSALNKQFSEETKLLAKKFHNNGFVFFPFSPYSSELIKTIKEKVNNLFDNPDHYEIRGKCLPNGQAMSYALTTISSQLQEVNQLLVDKVSDLLQCYYGSYFDIGTVVVWRNKNIPEQFKKNNEVFSERWHWDHRSLNMTKLFYMVDDISLDQGPFHFQSKQRSMELIKLGYKDRMDYGLEPEVIENTEFVNKLTGKAGDILLINTTYCLHKAGNPKKGKHRDIIQFQFFPSSKPLETNWLNNPVKTKTTLGKRGKI